MRHALTLLLVVLPGVLPEGAQAAPPEQRFELQPGGETLTLPLGEPVRIRLEGDVVEIAQSPEQLRITSRDASGTARLLVSTDTRFAVWSVRVDTPRTVLDPEKLEVARKACPGFSATPHSLEAQVHSAACLEALRSLTGNFLERELHLGWNVAGLRAQLRLLRQALDLLPEAKGLKLIYVGADLGLRGTLPDSAALDRVRGALFDANVGPLRLDLSKLKLADR